MTICGNDEVEVEIVGRRLNDVQNVQSPFGLVRVPLSRVDLRPEATFGVDVELLSDVLPIVLDFLALGVLLGPTDFGRVC